MNYTKFVRSWLSDKTTPEIAKDLGMSTATVYTRADKLRKAGVRLPNRVVRRTESINVDQLNKLIEESEK